MSLTFPKLFFSVTLWTFTRMYHAINTYHDWNSKLIIILKWHRYSLLPACLARCFVVLFAESGWPFLYVFVCYPLASMAGSWNAMFRIALLLSLNNICYLSIGAGLGVFVKMIPQGMIISTILRCLLLLYDFISPSIVVLLSILIFTGGTIISSRCWVLH